jgi:hypothetical protein
METLGAYRSDRTSAEARLSAALARRERALCALEEQHNALYEVNRQLAARGLLTAPRARPTVTEVEAPQTLELDECFRAVPSVDAETERLDAQSRELENLLQVLSHRLDGESDEHLPLAPAPRAVPLTYLLAEWTSPWANLALVFGAWFLPLGFMALIAMIERPEVPAALFVLVGLWATYRMRRAADRLRHVERAQVTVLGSGHTDTDYENWTVMQLSGWEAAKKSYTGKEQVTHLGLTASNGATGEMLIRGASYDDGVILCDARSPKDPVFLRLEKFACSPKPDDSGQWRGTLTRTEWMFVALGLATFIALALLALRG